MNAKSVCQVCALILLAANVALAGTPSTYYVKNGGDDGKTGLSDTEAWETIGKVNTEFLAGRFKAGDSILLKCGSKWGEQLVVTQSGNNIGGTLNFITIGAYGSGARPIVGYDEVFSGWTATAGRTNVYEISTSGIGEVFTANETTTTGSASGYFRVYSRRSSIQGVEDQVGSSYWIGGSTNKLYVHAYDDTDLSTTFTKTVYGNTRGFYMTTEGAMERGAVRTNDASYIKIQNIHAVCQAYGIGGMNTDNILIDDCRVSGTITATWFGHLQFETTTSSDVTTKNCEVRYNGNGLRHYNTDNVIVQDNTLSDSWNRVSAEDRTLVAVIGGFTSVKIHDNDFSEGKNGIEVDVRAGKTGKNIYIHHNRFHGDMYRGIAMWGSGTFAGDVHVYHNILWLPRADFIGPMGTTYQPKALILSAATNSSSEPFVVYNNTVSAKDGLFMDVSLNLVLKNNIFYECVTHINDDVDVVDGNPHTRNFNCYYPVDSAHKIEWAGTGYSSFSSYQDPNGRDIEHDGFALDPDFLNDPPNADDVKLLAAGEADNAGDNAGAPFDPSTAKDFYGLAIGGQASVGASEGVSAP